MRDSFILYTKYEKQIEKLSMEQRGVLFTAILAFERGEELPEMDDRTDMAFDFIRIDLEENTERYEKKCRQNAENGKLGGRPRKPKVTEKTERFSENRTQAKKADNDNDNDLKEKDNTSYYPKRNADCEALPLNDGSEWRPTEDEFNEFIRIYPAVNVRQEFASMRGWLIGNPTKRKTNRGIKRFVTSWLSRAQDKPKPTTNKWSAKVEQRDYDMDDLEARIMAVQ